MTTRGPSGPAIARLLEDALSGEPDANRSLIEAMTPVVHHRVARALRRHGTHAGLDVQSDLRDLAQEVWASLFEHDGRVLRSWSRDGGSSLENFVGLVAYRRAVSLIRARSSREIARLQDGDASTFEAVVSSATPEARAASRELVRELLLRLGSTLSARDLALFEGLFLREATVDELLRAGMKPSLVYTRKSRLARRARAVIDEIESAPATTDSDPGTNLRARRAARSQG